MSNLMNTTIGFVGLGLIGGSLAKAIHTFHPEYHIMAYDNDSAILKSARQEGIIQSILSEKDERFASCDYIFLCVPVTSAIDYLPFIKEILKEDALFSDVGSVKGAIHAAVHALDLQDKFIGGHPMAGSEKSGYQYARAALLENAYYIITPSDNVPLQKTAEYVQLISSIGAIPLVLSYDEHDYITAGVSHVPHIAAAALVHLIANSDNEDQLMKLLAAGGFKDITRIASSSPSVWQQICLQNSDNISKLLDEYIKLLVQARLLIDNKDADGLFTLFETAGAYRNSMQTSASSPLQQSYLLYCDLADEIGGISRVSGLLATHLISIKNIGIIHNREFDEGVLEIQFYDATALQRAAILLSQHNYTVYER
ncbi:MAG: prephenate dehydrogenase/arogenate dehydrogenase family protein [Lachnospiraceae bacterium]